MYIISRDRDRPLALGLVDGVLGHDSFATLFMTYEAARHAIRRTRRYADRHGYKWDEILGAPKIIRVEVGG